MKETDPSIRTETGRLQDQGHMIVEFRKSKISVVWDDEADSILSFAEDQGLSPPFSCRGGICSTCKTTLISGTVDYFDEPLNAPEPGSILLCCSKPRSSIILDI
jgi:ferredoxin